MTPEEIRAEAIEVIAWQLLELDDPYAEHPADDWRAEYHPRAVPFVDALAAAGLLPTGVETRAVDGGVQWTHRDGSRSTLPVYGSERRYVTAWEVSE
ncbi:hypothetical protein [Nocardia australiensis]|uniref:hypothetical protein n=1 Tax=Nocardia australiensis TaxID=2887191 RepID=UPI001D155FBA|nr:hypothetical protein [Nocardia australiensis]